MEKCGHKVVRSKMLVGDYQLANDGSIAIDTKSGVMELIADIYHQHERFRRECELAKDAGIQLIILTEEVLPDGRLDKWKSPVWKSTTQYHRAGEPMTKADPARLRKAMYTMQDRYGVKFRFCDGRSTGKRIIELLTKEAEA
jgi:ribosome-associated protein